VKKKIYITKFVSTSSECDWLRTGWPGFDSQQGQEISLFSTASRLALGLSQPRRQLVLRVLFSGLKRPVREADHALPSNAEVKNGGAVPLLHHKFSWRGF
jgi:hypothetical protein